MDEIDAALDFKNVSIVAHYVKEQTKCDPEGRIPTVDLYMTHVFTTSEN